DGPWKFSCFSFLTLGSRIASFKNGGSVTHTPALCPGIRVLTALGWPQNSLDPCTFVASRSFHLRETMRSISRFAVFAVVFAVALFSAHRAFGQGGATGAISGSVVDTSGAGVGGAEVQIISAATEALFRRVPVNADGEFFATLLPPGRYIFVVTKSGSAEAKAENIKVRVTETTRVTITLKPGSVTEKIEIIAEVT